LVVLEGLVNDRISTLLDCHGLVSTILISSLIRLLQSHGHNDTKAGMAHSACRWNAGCVIPWQCVLYLSTLKTLCVEELYRSTTFTFTQWYTTMTIPQYPKKMPNLQISEISDNYQMDKQMEDESTELTAW